MIERIFNQFRKVSIIAVLASVLGSLLMFVIGAVKVVRAYNAYLLVAIEPNTDSKVNVGLSIAYLVQAIDAFLIALILMIFGYGVFILIVADEQAVERATLSGFQIRSVSELKRILADMIVVILMVKFLESALVSTGSLGWEALVLPAAILLLAAAVRVLKLEH
ncbi:MAG: YqhA family protein [Woeseiaceae bacterium]